MNGMVSAGGAYRMANQGMAPPASDNRPFRPELRDVKCAFIVGQFPALSEAFLVNLVACLIDLGMEVRIFRASSDQRAFEHQTFRSYNLGSIVKDLPPPSVINVLGDLLCQLSKLGLRKFLWSHLDAIRNPRGYHLARFRIKPILEFRPDLILCNFLGNGSAFVFLRKIGVVKSFVTAVYGGDVSIRNLRIDSKSVFDHSDRVVAISNHIRSVLLERGCDSRKISRIPLPVEPSEFLPGPSRLAEGPLRVLSIGRLVEKKGFLFGIRAVASAIGSGMDVSYTVVGEGPMRSELMEEISRLGLEERVHLVGGVAHTELSQFLADSDVLLAPSVTAGNGDMEGQVVVIQEAGLAALPVIASRHNGIPDGVLHEQTGFLVDEKDVEGIAACLEILHNNPPEVIAMGKAHREFVMTHYSREVISESWHGLLTEPGFVLK